MSTEREAVVEQILNLSGTLPTTYINQIIDLVLDEAIDVAKRYLYKDTIGDASALTDEEVRNNTRITHLIEAIEDKKW